MKIRTLCLVLGLFTLGCAAPAASVESNPVGRVSAQSELLAQADTLFRSRQYEESRPVYLLALQAADKVGDNSTAVEALSQVARTYLTTDKKEEGRPWLEKARVRVKEGEGAGWGRYLGVKGRFEWKDDQLEEARRTFVQQYDFCMAQGLYEMSVDAAHMVAIVAPPDQQLEWAQKGITAAEKGNLPGWLGPLWNNLAYTYETLGDYPRALDCYLKARTYHYQVGDEKARYVADWAVGRGYRLTGQLEEAERWLTQALAAVEQAGDGEFIGLTHEELGEIDRARGSAGEARTHFTVAYQKLEEAGALEWDPERMARLEGYLKEAP